ncbi:unnamed protein product [Caenorhabditis angaria]|uniref:Uncharacterized protein n=1 Tax=Caenorhabditis angaria TaxID=860376 RepID=A0A9P1I255_9PELO|nr:unnamed protein product [Caenorhabditis angaria]
MPISMEFHTNLTRLTRCTRNVEECVKIERKIGDNEAIIEGRCAHSIHECKDGLTCTTQTETGDFKQSVTKCCSKGDSSNIGDKPYHNYLVLLHFLTLCYYINFLG